VLKLVEQGHFSNGDGELFRPLLENLTGRDPFCVLADFADYLRVQQQVSAAWADRRDWNRLLAAELGPHRLLLLGPLDPRSTPSASGRRRPSR
jgi:glucan phosphorylase